MYPSNPLPIEITELINESKLNEAVQILQFHIRQAISDQQHVVAINYLRYLSRIEGQVTHSISNGLLSLNLALEFAEKLDDKTLYADVQYDRAVILGTKNIDSALTAIDKAILVSQPADDFGRLASLRSLSLQLKMHKKLLDETLLNELEVVADAWRKSERIDGMVSHAYLMAFHSPYGALALLTDANTVLEKVSPSQLAPIPQGTLIKMSISGTTIHNQSESSIEGDSLKEQWSTEIQNARNWIQQYLKSIEK